MTRIKGLWQDKRTGIYYLRRKIPDALRPAFACGEFYKVTLGTGDLREAEKRLAIANGEYEKKLADYREALKGAGAGSLTTDEARALITRLLTARSAGGFASGGMQVAFILRDLDQAVADLSGERMPTAQTMSGTDWAEYRKRVAGSEGDDEFSPETLARIEAEHAARHRPYGEAWFDFQRRVSRRRWRPLLALAVAEIKRELKLPDGATPGTDEPLADALADALRSPEVRQQLPVASSARRRPTTVRARPEMKLDELLALWVAKRKPRPKAIAASTKAVADFNSYIGDVGIGEITSADCFEFRDAYEMMPNSMPLAHRRMAFANAHAIYASRTDIERVSPATVKKYLGSIQALLGFAFQERFVAANVSAGIRVDGYSKAGDRRPFTKGELARLFAAALFTQPWSKRHGRSQVSSSTLRWLFLLGLCTGARLEELGQILLGDIKIEEGVAYIDVTDYVAIGIAEENSVKNDGSRRVLPIHPKLTELGFLDHVAGLRFTGKVRLFPDLKADSLLVKTKEASRCANRIIDRFVDKDSRLVFHSFRHSFKDLCRDADIPLDVHNQLTGHAPADVGSGYGLGRALGNLSRHLGMIDLSFVDWSLIEPAAKL